MYRNGSHYRENKSWQDEPDSDAKHYPTYYTATCQREKELHTVCLFTVYLPFIVFFSREIYFAKCWTEHSLEHSWSLVLWNSSPLTSLLKLTWAICALFCVQFVSVLYFINVSVIQNFVPSSLLSSLFLFLTGDNNSAFCEESKSLYFPKIWKLMWNSSILVAYEQCWRSLLKKVIYNTLHITLKNSNALRYMITPWGK